MAEESTVRENLMTRPDCTPYCGNFDCPKGMPRTHLINGQFQCACGWRSQFPADFMERYLTKGKDAPNGQLDRVDEKQRHKALDEADSITNLVKNEKETK